MSNPQFVHLHCHSEYSIKSSLLSIPQLIATVKKHNMTSVALTDMTNLFAAVKFYQEAVDSGIKPVFGSQLTIKDGDDVGSVLLLCQNKEGYLNLSKLISLAYLEGQDFNGVSVTIKQLISHSKGLIMIAPPITSDIAKMLLTKNIAQAEEKAKFWQSCFANRFYLAVHRTERDNDERYVHSCINLGLKLNIAVVATNNVEFIKKSDYYVHEVKVCIAEGLIVDDARRERRYSEEQYLKSPQQMVELFADFPELITNSVEISKRCNLHFQLHKENYLPDFDTPNGVDVNSFIKNMAYEGLEKRLKNLNVDKHTYYKRLDFELDIINKMNFSGYFLIVTDFVAWSRRHNIHVGPGRGSGTGSLVSYALCITSMDPIEHDLLFERFLNPERTSMPDFDIDFCAESRDEVIDYVYKKYGRNNVSQIITYGKMAAKGVVRDVARVLGHPYGVGDTISKLIPNELNITLEQALRTSNDGGSNELLVRYNSDESVTTIIDLSKKLEGLIRNVGVHAGGIIIAPGKISDFCPVYKGSNNDDCVVSQFDKDDIEAIGLVKFDFLGLLSLTTIDKAVKIITSKKLNTKPINLSALPLDDEKVYKLLQKADTAGIFQLESRGMREYLYKLKADHFDDIVAMLALYRPGPLGSNIVDDYINVKHGSLPKYPHNKLIPILKKTNGIILYQEQVMQTAQILAGYTLAAADLLCRAMSKKKVKEMDKQRVLFEKGASKLGVSNAKAQDVFNLISSFSNYGFNKSHSVAYAYISYQTAWLKVHYKAAFMAAVLSGEMGDTDKVASTISEVRKMNIYIEQPSILKSNYEFDIKDNSTIIYGLGSIKGLGKALVEAITKERNNGNYKNLFDFCVRITKKYINKRVLEALIYSGAFDDFKVSRASLIKTYPKALQEAEQRQNDIINGQSGLFYDMPTNIDYDNSYLQASDFSFKEQLTFEKSVMGYYFYNHPVDEYKDCLKNSDAVLLARIVNCRRYKELKVIAMIAEVHRNYTKDGKQMARVIIENNNFQVSAVIFNKIFNLVSDKLIIGDVVLISGVKDVNSQNRQQLIINDIEDIKKFRLSLIEHIFIKLNDSQQELFSKLINIFKCYRGECPIKICYQYNNIIGDMYLGEQYFVNPNIQLINAIDNLLGINSSRISYKLKTHC